MDVLVTRSWRLYNITSPNIKTLIPFIIILIILKYGFKAVLSDREGACKTKCEGYGI